MIEITSIEKDVDFIADEHRYPPLSIDIENKGDELTLRSVSEARHNGVGRWRRSGRLPVLSLKSGTITVESAWLTIINADCSELTVASLVEYKEWRKWYEWGTSILMACQGTSGLKRYQKVQRQPDPAS